MKLQAMVFAGLLACAGSANAATLFSQPYDGGSNLIASQNDTSGGQGNFATTYDHFTLSVHSDVEDVEWTGGYFNPPNQGQITAWTVNFYANNAGAPGGVLSSQYFTNNGGETFLTVSGGGFPIYTYSETFASIDMAAGTYFVSVEPDLGFPPQWGWATGTGGDGGAYQTFFGTTSPIGVSMAFDITGTTVLTVPEPSTWAMMMLGFAGLGFAGYRAARKSVAAA